MADDSVFEAVAVILRSLAAESSDVEANTSRPADFIKLPGRDNSQKKFLERELAALVQRVHRLETKAFSPPAVLPDTPDTVFGEEAASAGNQAKNGPKTNGFPLDEALGELREHVDDQSKLLDTQRQELAGVNAQLLEQKELQERTLQIIEQERVATLERELWKHQKANEAFQKALREIGEIVTAVARGDLSKKVRMNTVEMDPEITTFKRTINTMMDQLQVFSSEVSRVAREVGTEGILGGQAQIEGVDGTWKELTDNVNVMAQNLTDQVREIASVTTAVAHGDLTKKIERPAKGEILQLQQTINTMVDQLRTFASAENRGNVTCYLDALLFAMFANLSAFECMLKNDLTDEHTRKLASLIRLWVNMLRSGKLIHTDMTHHIQDALAACGWKDAQRLEQQDTSEAFAFITETLQLPLLALQVDLFHHGKRDEDDHKVVHERLLNLAVPPDPEGKGLKLEDCLEEYFNNKVDVFRDDLEEKKAGDRLASSRRTTIRVVAEEGDPQTAEHIEISPIQRKWTAHDSLVQSPVETPTSSTSQTFESPALRHRSTSIIQRIVVNNDGEETSDSTNSSFLQKAKRTGSTVVKAVTIPAWQFFRLIPWHTTSNNEPISDAEVARHFNKRPMLGICLKRYTMTAQGVPIRQNTQIDIPDSMRLPHFMVVDDIKGDQESSGLNQEYKLVLQSVVCHRGDSLHSGHYIAFARVAPKLLTDNRRQEHDPPPDYEEAQWVKFDDLAVDGRVTYVDDIKQSLREEMPYLLFYQIVPMVDVTAGSTDGSVAGPPSYFESSTTTVGGQIPAEGAAEQREGVSRSTSGYFDSASTLPQSGPSIRLSADMERPTRISFDEDAHSARAKADSSRRGSTAASEPAVVTPAVTPDAPSPAISPQDESTAARLSRAAAKFTKTGSKSRPTSQAGEGRINLTISRLGFSRPSREPLNGAVVAANAAVAGTVTETLDEQAVIVEEVEATEKEKEHHHHHHLHQGQPKKERTKSKSREKEEKKDKGKMARESKADVPDRECAVM